MKNEYEVRLVHHDPAGGMTVTWAHGETLEKLNENIEFLLKFHNWDRKYVEVIAEKDKDNGKWYSR